MFTVALVGGDGAGKTTVARHLQQSLQMPIKYVYMGSSMRSSNVALPTTRLVLFLKQRAYKKCTHESDPIRSDDLPAQDFEYSQAKHGPLWTCARLLNRLAEAWFRQAVAFKYKMQGYVIIFDRHCFFDSAPDINHSDPRDQQGLDQVYYWIMSHWYPRPDLAILLDAPGELLYERKKEASPEYLNRQRSAFLEQGKKLKNFVRVDATQPLDRVLVEVERDIMDFSATGCRRKGNKH